MLAKYINETEIKELAGCILKHNGRTFTNPTEDQIKAAGYVKVSEPEAPPEYNAATEESTLHYKNGDPIKAFYVIKKKEENS